ncbi:MAG: AMP-binding protein, partial [Rubrobacteraceae bacterium]
MTPAERHQVLVEWNDTDAEYPRHLSAHQLFEAQAEKTPDLPALVFEGETLSYRELNERANRLAHHLRRRGAGPETLVAIYAERSFEMIVGLLGVLKAGAAYLPLDPSYPEELTAFMLEDARASLLLTEQGLLPRLSHPRSQTICLDADENEIAREGSATPANLAAPHNLAYLIYTSGSTGKPKGVMVRHRNLVSSTTARLSFYGEVPGGFLLLSSLAFDSSVAGIFGTLCGGGELWLPSEEARRDPA